MNTLLIHAWTVHRYNNNYYLPYTHWVYLSEISKYFNKICLLSPVKEITKDEQSNFISLKLDKKLFVNELPFSSSYVGAIKFFFSYFKSYQKLEKYDVVYARYPIPFGWLQKIFCKNSKRIIHFVGDPIDATLKNPNFSISKKKIYTTLFLPEHSLYLWACKGAYVYTNGHHLAKRLQQKNIHAMALMSSTLIENDFCKNINKKINTVAPKLIYVGYLRKAKGIETLLKAFQIVINDFPNAEFSIVGSGEFELKLKQIVNQNSISNVNFLGHIDDRNDLNNLLRRHDIFCFASLSEGSPRVILEAMANGINVVSTPVGSLPSVFTDGLNISFADFDDELSFSRKIIALVKNEIFAKNLRDEAFNKVKRFTISNFIKSIFNAK